MSGIKKNNSFIIVAKKKIEITNPDRILFPKVKIKKIELINYYQRVASLMLPLIKNHPLTLQRFPSGIHGEGFFQKDAGSYFPDWMKRVTVPKSEGGNVHYVVASSEATIVYLANQAAIVLHIWASKVPKLNYPDRMIFDLDPSGTNFTDVRHGALELKEILEDHNLHTFVMTTGSRGLHVTVPLKPKYTFDQVGDYATRIADILLESNPKKYTVQLRKAKRGNRIFIDTLRNRKSATAVAPYSVRATEHASVALPLSWREVHNTRLKPNGTTIKDIKKILARSTEWENFVQVHNVLSRVIT